MKKGARTTKKKKKKKKKNIYAVEQSQFQPCVHAPKEAHHIIIPVLGAAHHTPSRIGARPINAISHNNKTNNKNAGSGQKGSLAQVGSAKPIVTSAPGRSHLDGQKHTKALPQKKTKQKKKKNKKKKKKKQANQHVSSPGLSPWGFPFNRGDSF